MALEGTIRNLEKDIRAGEARINDAHDKHRANLSRLTKILKETQTEEERLYIIDIVYPKRVSDKFDIFKPNETARTRLLRMHCINLYMTMKPEDRV